MFAGARLRGDPDAGARVRAGADARRPGRRRSRVQAVRRAGQRARPALGHDDPDRARRRAPATRPPSPPLRFCYVAHAYRSVRPQRGQDREMLQAGIELVGVPAHEGTAEALAVLCEALDAVGLAGYRIGLGDASLYPALLDAHGVAGAGARRDPARARSRATSSGWSARSRALRLGAEATAALVERPAAAGRAGGARRTPAPRRTACAPCSTCSRPRSRERVIFDLGLARSLGYYTGAVFEVYDAALGAPLGRRRPLRRPARPLRPRPARRGLGAERRAAAHRAGRRAPRGAAVSLGGLRLAVPARRADRATRSTCSTRSASTPPRCARTTASCCSRTRG